MTLVLIARGKIGGVRSAESERNTEPLRVADRNVRAKFARRLEQSERENVGSDDNERASVVRLLYEFGIIVNRAIGCRILNECAKNCVVECEACEKLSILTSMPSGFARVRTTSMVCG